MALTMTEKWSDGLSSPRPIQDVKRDATKRSDRTTESADLIDTDSVVATSSPDGPLTEERSSFLASGAKRGLLWLAASLLLALLAGWWSGAGRDGVGVEHLTPAVRSAAEAVPKTSERGFVSIEAIRVGDRVLADNPDDGRPASSQPTEVDSSTWRKLVLRGELVWEDGTVDDVNVETLQPPEWVAAHDARVGNLVPLPLDLIEMGLPKGLKARVLENLPCPPIRPGPGRVVLTTVDHLNNYVFELRVEDEQGRRTTFRPTGFHKFFSADRSGWISADSLVEGERLTALGGTVRLLSKARIEGTHRVYNLTVEDEHVYHVTNLVVDGHNNGCAPKRTGDMLDRLQEAKRQFQKNRDFRNWAHKEFMEDMKMAGGGRRNPDIPDSMIADAYDEWLELGKPKL